MKTIQTASELPPQVFLVDDDQNILRAFSRLLGAAGFQVQAFTSPHEFLSRHDKNAPGCALLDISMGDMDGLELQAALFREGVHRPIIFITGRNDAHTSVRALKAGAVDYLTKPVDEAELIAAVESALSEDRRAREKQSEIMAIRARHETLTPREKEVMAHVITGQLNKQIAFDLGTVEKTVKVHRARVMAKMGVRTVAALVRMAERLEPHFGERPRQ
jgi:FixJ family two-component response regulator